MAADLTAATSGTPAAPRETVRRHRRAVVGLPTTVLVDARGRIVARPLGLVAAVFGIDAAGSAP